MSLAHILARYVAPPMPRSDTGAQALLADCRATSPFTSGPAETASPPPRFAGTGPMVEREILIAEARHQRDLRQSKAASLTEARLRALTTAILRGGYAKTH